jgi:hypothetical protein
VRYGVTAKAAMPSEVSTTASQPILERVVMVRPVVVLVVVVFDGGCWVVGVVVMGASYDDRGTADMG